MDNNNDFIKNWMEGKISPEELKKRKSKGDNFVQELDEIITRASTLKVPDKTSKEEAWQRLSSKLTETQPPQTKVVKIAWWVPASIAASVLLAVVAFFSFSKTTITTPLAETKVVVLPDGSEVTLNADSKISFNKPGWSDERTVTLEGEAFFQVKKGSSFTVESEAGTVTVLGTSFNVNARLTTFEVSCFTGKVNVRSGNDNVILTKGEFTKLDANRLIHAEPFDTEKGTWRNGEFYFDRQPLHLVIDELERQFDIEIIYSDDGSRLYSGYFSNRNMDEALDMVLKPMSLKYHRKNNKTIVVQ